MEQKNKQKEESPIAWLFSQVGDKKPYFVMSILLAFLSVISGIMPYFVVAKIVSNLVSGEKDFKVYMMLGVWMTVSFYFYLFIAWCDLCHSCQHTKKMY